MKMCYHIHVGKLKNVAGVMYRFGCVDFGVGCLFCLEVFFMAFCTHCGTQVGDNDKFCPKCGASLGNAGGTQGTYDNRDNPGNKPFDPPSGRINVGMLVWSIICIFLCTPFGVWALVMTITAKNAPTAEEEQKKLETAKTVNIVATVIGAVLVVIELIITVITMATVGSIFFGFWDSLMSSSVGMY